MNTRESFSELKVDKTPLRVTPVTNYDPFEAKFCASLYWLVFRATEDGGLDEIPPQVTSPLERDTEHRITVRPEVIELLTNDEIYGKVCDCIFNHKEPVVGHWAVIQSLSRHGFYVVEEGDIAVTDSTLQQRKPFRKSTHLALMDALMAAYSSKVVTIPQVVQAVRKIAPFNASKELPFDLEDSLLLWINKVCTTLNDKEIKKQKLHAEDLLRDQDKAKRFRFRRDQLQPKVQAFFPVTDDLLKSVSDGLCLLGVVMFYHQDAVKINDIHFGQNLSQEKIVHNIELFRSLCSQHICTTALSLQVEDFMYSSHAMKPNIVVLLAEMFYKCEFEEDQVIEEDKRSKSCVTEVSNLRMKEEITKNLGNNRSSSAPMLASEIIAARSPAVGRKLMDLAKEKNKQRSDWTPEQLSGHKNSQQNKRNNTTRKSSNESQNKPLKSKQNRSYSLQLDFTDERTEGIEVKSEVEQNPFVGKPVLASRKYSAPERVGGGPQVLPRSEPRLNKRAKQKQRALALEDWEMEEKDMEDIHVTDLQRSQSLTGLDKTNIESRQSFHAWQEGTSSSDTNLDMKKSQRISLDFRPSHQLTSSQAYERGLDKHGLQATNKYKEDRLSQDSLKSNDSLSNKPVYIPMKKDVYLSETSRSCTSSMSERELKEFEEMEAMILARRSNDSNKAPTNNAELSEEDLLNASVSSDDMNRFRLEVLQRLTEDKVRCMEKQHGNKDGIIEQQQQQQQQPAMPGGNEGVRNGDIQNKQQTSLDPHGNDAEELLSPINESSEPLLILPETRASTPSTTPSSPCSPLEVAPFMPAFFMTSPANTIDKKAYKTALAAKTKQERKEKLKEALGAEAVEPSVSKTPRFDVLMRGKEMTPRNKSLEVLTRGSYTVDQMSVDAAKAAGIPVIGNERVSELASSAAYRTTTRSLSVPEPLEHQINQDTLNDRGSMSSSHLKGQVHDKRAPQELSNENNDAQGQIPIRTHAMSYRDQRFQDQEQTKQFSPRPSEDVVIFDRKTSEVLQDANTHAQDWSPREHHVDNNAVLTTLFTRQSYVEGTQGSTTHGPVGSLATGYEINPGQYGGSVGPPDNRLVNRQTEYQEQFVAAVSKRLISQGQFDDDVDASHVRVSQSKQPSRNSFINNTGTYIGNSPRDGRNSFVSNLNADARNSFIGQNTSVRNSFAPMTSESVRNSFVSNPGADMRNSFVGQDARSSFVSNQGNDFRHSFVSNAGMDSSRNSAYIGYSGTDPVSEQESRNLYTDQYGTYVKSSRPRDIPQGYQGAHARNQGFDGEYSSPRQPQERFSSPGQFATFRKPTGSPLIQRQPSPGYHLEQHIPTNQITAPYCTSQVTSVVTIGQQRDLQYVASPTSQQYSSTGHAHNDPRNQSTGIYSNPPMEFQQNSSSRYRTQELRSGCQQHPSDTYRDIPIPNQHGYEPNFGPRVTQMQENIRTQSPSQSAPQSPRTQNIELTRTQSPRVQNSEKQPRDSEEQRAGTPERKSQAFTVDLDTGELKEVNSSSESMSPRSPGSTIIRSRTFKKGPEERVFGFDAKSLPGKQNQVNVSPQVCDNEPAVVHRKENNPNCINKTSWSESAEALMAVLHNGFPNENKFKKEDRVTSSPRRRNKSRPGDRSSPSARITWVTAGQSGCGGQVLLNEKGEIEESKNNEAQEDTAATKHLAFLRLHFDDKRRQIEAEKRRNQEHWEEERRKLGETLFWYTMGRAQGENEPGHSRPGHEGSIRVNEPLKVITSLPRATDYSGPSSSGQPTPPIGVSTPLMSPLSAYPIPSKPNPGYHSPAVEGYQSPREPGFHIPPSFGHGYHQTSSQRPGYQSPTIASPVYQSPISSQTSNQSPISSQAGYQSPVSSQTGYQSPISSQTGYQSPISSQTGYQSPISLQSGFQFPSSNGAGRQSSNGFGYQGNPEIQGYRAESTVNPSYVNQGQEYETHEFRLSEYAPLVTTPQDNVPTQKNPQNNGPSKSPSRKCWEVNNPTVPPSVPGFAPPSSEGNIDRDESRTGAESHGYNDVIEDEESSPKKVFSMFIGDEPDKMKEQGLTPEQQRKRDKFLRSRQKKLEEEKAKRESENEKKRQREQKQRESEIQKRLEEEEKRNETHQRSKQSRERLSRENAYNRTAPWSNQPDDHSAFAEFSGPQCYVKPSGKSNRKLIINAISHVCLSGTVNNESKERCLQAISECQGFHFIVLFKDGLKFRGLYMHNPENEQSYKIYGIGPKVLTSKMVDCVYKYSSGSKEFVKIPSKTLSISVDGVAINKIYWQSNKPNVASKTQSNLKRPPRPPQR